MVKQIIEDATEVLKAIVIPKVASRVKAEAEARGREDHDQQLQEEVRRLANEKLARAAKQDRQLKEKLMAVLEG